ncbi:MAG TPA: DinB family protein [Acidimicrobiales bacterium]
MARSACPLCGLDEETMAPGDTTATVRSLPRRYGALLRTPGGEEDRPDEVARRQPPGGGPSALALTAGLAGLLEATLAAEERLLVADTPEVAVPSEAGAAEPAPADGVETVLGRLEEASRRLGDLLARVPSGDWARAGHRPDGSEVTVLGLARRAAHLGPHLLRQVDATLREVRGR